MKRIISTILTISMLFTMIPAFASDIDTSDVNNIAQLFSEENSEANAELLIAEDADFSEQEVYASLASAEGKVVASSAKKINKKVIDMENCELVTNVVSASGMPFSFTPVSGGTFDIAEENGNKFVTFRQNANEASNTTGIGFPAPNLPGNTAIISYKLRFDAINGGWTMFNLGNTSSLYLSGKAFKINEAGSTGGGQKDLKTGVIELGEWYTIKYIVDQAALTYNITITKEDGTEIANADTKARYWEKGEAHLKSLSLYTSQKDPNLCQMSVDDVTFYSEEVGLFFDVIGSENLTDSETLKINYTNSTDSDKDVCVTYVAFEDGVVADVDEVIETLPIGEDVAEINVSVDISDCTGEITYGVFVTDPANGSTLCTAGSKKGTIAPENFVTVAEGNGQINVSVTKDSSYDAAIIRVYDEDDNLVGIKEQKVTSAPVSFDVKNYNKEYKADVTLTDAEGNCAYAEDSIIVWNPSIAEDFNNDPETAFVTHMDALNKAYEGFEDIYNADAEYINNYIMMRNDYTSVYDVVDTAISLGGFLEILKTEDEASFALALEANADSLGIDIDDFYYENKDAIIAKLFADKEDDMFVIPDELVEAYNEIYVITEFNVAPAISYGSLFEKYAVVLGITVDKSYKDGEATINELIYQYKEDNGGSFEDTADIAAAFKNAKNNAENPVGYDTVAISPNYPVVDVVDFEELEVADNKSTNLEAEGYSVTVNGGIYNVVEENGNKYLNLTGPEKTKRAVELKLPGKDYGNNAQISTKFKANKLSNWILFYVGSSASCLNIQDGVFKENWGTAKAPSLNSKTITTGVWYTITWNLDVDSKSYDLYIVNSDDPSDVIVDMDDIPFRNQDISNGSQITSLNFSTSSEHSTETDVAFDDIRRGSVPADELIYKAKGLNNCISGANDVAVNIQNFSGEDKAVNVYIPVYINGVLSTVAYGQAYVAHNENKDVVVSFDLDDVQADNAKYEVVVAESLGGYNYGIVSSTAAGTLEVDATADYENDVINVTADSTFDNGTIIVLAPGATLANATPADILYYATGNTAAVKVADGIKGDLKVYAVAQDADGDVTVVNDTVYYPGNGVAENLSSDFSGVTEDNVASVVANYMTIINSIEPGMATFYAENSVEVNAALVANKPYSTTEDVINAFKSVKAVKALKAAASEAEFEVAFDEFVAMFDVERDDIYNYNKATFISAMYADKEELNTYEDVMNAYAAIYMVCEINTATEATIGTMLAKYAVELGITLDDVYTTKQVYIDRLVATDMPFADKAAIVSSYNDAYAKAEEIEGDFSKVIVAESAKKVAMYEYNFDELEAVSGQKGTYDSEDKTYTISASSSSTYDIVDDNGNKYIRLNQPAGDEDKAKLKINNLAVGAKTSLSYRIMFESLDKGYTRLQYGGGSVFYIQNEKFGVNYGGGKMDQSGSKENVTTNVWYNVNYSVEYDANDKNKCKYDVVVTKDDGKLVFESRNCVFRDSGIANIEFVTPHRDDPKNGPAALTEVDTVMCIDAIKSSAFEAGNFYYTANGTKNLLPGNNKLSFDMNNTTSDVLTANIYVPVYVDGKLDSITTKSVSVEAGGKAPYDVTLTAPNTGNINYKVFVVESLEGVNYGVDSKAELPRETIPTVPVADYATRTIKVSGSTTYDNMTIIVTAPTADSSAYDIADANGNADVIAYYNVAEFKTLNSEKDATTGENVVTSSFAADIKIPDKFVDGDYYVYFVSQNQEGITDVKRKTVYYAGSAKLDDMLADFNAVTESNVETTINTYMDVLLGVASDMDAFYTANKAAVNEAVVAGKPYANVGAVNNTIFAIYAADKLKNVTDVDTFKSTLEYYASVFGIDVTSVEYIAGAAEINNRLFNDRANITKLNLASKFANALMLSEVNNATREMVDAVLTKYATILGIDVSSYDYVTYKTSIARAIAADDTVFNSVADVKMAYEQGVAHGKESGVGAPVPSTPSGGGGGGGFGGGGGSPTNKVFPAEPYVEPEKTVDGATATSVAFNDLGTVSWAVEAITELKRIGVINGVSETEFAPDREVTREEFAKMIVNAFSITGEGKSFADVPATAWYAPYVTALASSGIVNGVTETTFGVGAKITRQDAAVILDRTAMNTGINYEHKYSAVNIFTDYIAGYAIDSIYRLFQNGVISGTSATTFSATATLTRAQAAKMIYSLMQLK